MWDRTPILGEPVLDLANDKIGIAVSINHTADTVVLQDEDGHQWEASLADTEPYAVIGY